MALSREHAAGCRCPGCTGAPQPADFIRVSGDIRCTICGKLYYDHPYAVEEEWLGMENRPILRWTCNGDLVKL